MRQIPENNAVSEIDVEMKNDSLLGPEDSSVASTKSTSISSMSLSDETDDCPSPTDSEKCFARRRKYSFSSLGLKAWHQNKDDAGGCFGVDFGGTLTKVVFFEPENIPAKAVYLAKLLGKSDKYGQTGEKDVHLSFVSRKLGGRFHFIRFESSHTKGALKILKSLPQHNIRTLHGTGGGAHKYSRVFKKELGIYMRQHDELETVVTGIVFTLLEHPDSECYTYEDEGDTSCGEVNVKMKQIPYPITLSGTLFPLLVVNIGSGVSILKVDSPNHFKRVSGTALGGATYYGLCKLLCLCKSFDEAMDMAASGDSRNINLLVRDIYGGSYDSIGLSGTHTASFFGKSAASRGTTAVDNKKRKRLLMKRVISGDHTEKIGFWERLGLVIMSILSANLLHTVTMQAENTTDYVRAVFLLITPLLMTFGLFYPYLFGSGAQKNPQKKNVRMTSTKETEYEGEHENYKPEDISRALVVMIAQNITQLAFLNARLHNANRVVFTGNFLRHNNIAQRTLSNNMRVWSNGEIVALFMQHEGYFGAMGSFLFSSNLDANGEEAE